MNNKHRADDRPASTPKIVENHLGVRTHRYWNCPAKIDGENNLSTNWEKLIVFTV